MAQRRGTASLLVRLSLAVMAAAVLGLLALVGVAALSARPTLFLLAGLGVFVAATAAGVPLWGVALGAATLAFYLRRRGRCRHCGSHPRDMQGGSA